MSDFKEKIKNIMDSTFGSTNRRLNTEESMLKTGFQTKIYSIDLNKKDASRNKIQEGNKPNKYSSNIISIQKIQSDINMFDLKRKSKSNIKAFTETASNNDSNKMNNKRKFDIDFLYSKEGKKDTSFSDNQFRSKKKDNNTHSNSINYSLSDIRNEKAINGNSSFSGNCVKSQRSMIHREISSYSDTLKGKNIERESLNKIISDKESTTKSNIKNDIDYYLNYLSPTHKNKSSVVKMDNYLNQKYSSDTKIGKVENKLHTLLQSKQEKNVSQIRDLEAFTKDFSILNNKNKNSIFQQKLVSIQGKFLSDKTYLK